MTTVSEPPSVKNAVPKPTAEELKERQNLAEIHKRIRLEKQKTGRVISVADAKKILEDEQVLKKAGTVTPGRSPLVDKTKDGKKAPASTTNRAALERTRSKDKMSPAKMLPLNKLSRSRDQSNTLKNKTPSMVDLAPEKNQSPKGQKQSAAAAPVPASLTFEDIQKMHYSNLNKAAGGADDEFRPQDFLDLDSGDSDNEILAKFKPETDTKMISLLQPTSQIKQFVPPYLATSGHNIEEQTGYSNSPKFSIYRLNNQSNLKDGPQGFEDQMANLQSAQDMQLQSPGGNIHRQSNMFDVQNEYFPTPTEPAISNDQTPPTGPLSKQKANQRLRQQKPPVSSVNRKNTGISMRTPVINKGKAPLPAKSGGNRRQPAMPDDGKNDDIFQSHHNQLPRDVSILN